MESGSIADVISRRTIVWFVLLLCFTGGIELDRWQQNAPCREWKKAHHELSQVAVFAVVHAQDEGGDDTAFGPCNVMVWRSMPLWVQLCGLGWLVSAIGFLTSLGCDLWRWWRFSQKYRGPSLRSG